MDQHDAVYGGGVLTVIPLAAGKVVMRDDKVGTEQACCCNKCSGPCDEENPCPEGCCCGTTYLPGSPGILETGCRRISDGYACCCESYQRLCYVDMSYSENRAHIGPFPTIPGTPPPNAIALVDKLVYCDVNREVDGYWDYGLAPSEDEDAPEIAVYEFGYYVPISDCEDCPGQCTDWFDTGVFFPQFWGIFCDCATSNNIDVCLENPLP